ncbi:MAG: TonB C-terminal domain-containing protein [Nitrospirae bacterium]|nr:MAG: TonB C-terminal domain-containing protein [Nitrospirota bacterium]
MTAGLSHDMRRTALVSLVAHVVALVALTTVPLTKIPPRGASAIEVLLVSQPSAPVQVEQAPVPQPKPTPPPHQPKTAPVLPMPKSPPKPVTAAPTEPLSPKRQSSRDLAEAFQKAEDALAKPPVTKPLPPAQSPAPPSRTSEEIKKLLNTLPLPTPAMPSDATPATRELAPAVARAPQGTATVARPPTVEHCPPKARTYCPLLEAAINRVWNADTNPAVRQVLESAGDSTATMRIVIQPNGEIRDIALYRSSGNDAYDRAVESVLRELQRVPPLPDEMKGESFVAVTSFTYTKQ